MNCDSYSRSVLLSRFWAHEREFVCINEPGQYNQSNCSTLRRQSDGIKKEWKSSMAFPISTPKIHFTLYCSALKSSHNITYRNFVRVTSTPFEYDLLNSNETLSCRLRNLLHAYKLSKFKTIPSAFVMATKSVSNLTYQTHYYGKYNTILSTGSK